jgi:hypothetical protein
MPQAQSDSQARMEHPRSEKEIVMNARALATSAKSRVLTTHACSTFARLAETIVKQCGSLFSNLMRALEESQRRKAVRLIDKYRHLLSE